MKHLYEYINEIMDIASVNHAEPQNAKDMFLSGTPGTPRCPTTGVRGMWITPRWRRTCPD